MRRTGHGAGAAPSGGTPEDGASGHSAAGPIRDGWADGDGGDGDAGGTVSPGDDALDAAMISAYPSLLAYARLLTGNQARAEEVVHEALVRCLRRGRAEPIHEFAAYARRAVLNEVYRDARRRHREPLWTAEREDGGGWFGGHPDGGPRQDGRRDGIEAIVDQQVLRAWLVRLPVRQRAAVVSRYYLDMTEKDTADLLGCSVSAVKSLCHRGIALLRESAETGAVAGPETRAETGHDSAGAPRGAQIGRVWR